MNYSTFNLKIFFIKKNSTLPEIKFPLTQKLREMYEISDDMLENVAVTFSMVNADTGYYVIANTGADLVISNNPNEEKYTLKYRFKLKQTSKSGRFQGEFVIDFMGYGNCGKIKLPVSDYINIIIDDSITKTSVI